MLPHACGYKLANNGTDKLIRGPTTEAATAVAAGIGS
jgi:hypothetical protein